MEYPAIGDHGLIGDLRTAALVSIDGTIGWFCSPRFDSPSIFAALLDTKKGGHFSIRPAASTFSRKQLYLPGTAILVTRFLTPEGVGELVDFMPATGEVTPGNQRLIRLVRCVRGTMSFEIELAPRFDYGREQHKAQIVDGGIRFTSDSVRLTAGLVREQGDAVLGAGSITDEGDLSMTLTLKAGQTRGVVLDVNPSAEVRAHSPEEVQQILGDTTRYWHGWVGQSTYTGRWREQVERCAITLKLMTYAPTGGLVAAPTASLPEQIGGERNWDYRYTWVRDASFSVQALLNLGFGEEAAAFGIWLRDRVTERGGHGQHPLNIMYRVDGSSDLSEEIISGWEGYAGSAPVHIGNGAADQLQLDIYGEALDSVWHLDRSGYEIGHHGWVAICEMMDWLVENWDQPEEGIWETRGGRKNFTYGRVMCWVAFDRAIRLAAVHGWPAAVQRWTEERDAIYTQVMEKGWNEDKQAFVQEYSSDVLDSALLKMPKVGFMSPKDPMWLSTLQAMETELVSDSLVYRYNPSASPDGLRGDEGTFSLCTFLYVDALAGAGRIDESRLVFEKMLTYANHLGLFSEEIAPTGEQIGNFPQAFTHLALIEAAISLNEKLDSAFKHRNSG